jgi:LPXTG-motif cell wall-anchored protein
MKSLRRTGRLACLVVSVPLVLLPAAPAAASCVPSEAMVLPASAEPGQAIRVSSSNWFGICNDTGQQVDVTDRAVVTFVQGNQRVELGRTNSNAEGVFSLEVRLPERATTGPAVLEVRGRAAADDVSFTVKAATLPRTGSSGTTYAGLLALVVAGVSVLLGRRALHEG